MRRRVTGAAVLALVTALPLSPADAGDECPGTRVIYRKVVQDLTGAETTGQQIASGVMGNIYAYDRTMMCYEYADGAENYAVSALRLHLGDVVHDGQMISQLVEGGFYYRGGIPMIYLSYVYVSGGTLHTKRVTPTAVMPGQWFGFNISPHSVTASGTSFKLQYVAGESQTGWTTLATTPTIPDGLGTPMVFGSRTAHANGNLFARQLKYRPTSGWFSWTHLGCYMGYGGNNDPSWDVVKFSETAFYTANQAPEPGGC